METIFGRTYINSEAEKRLTSADSPLSFFENISASVKMANENNLFYRRFGETLALLDDYFASNESIDLSVLKGEKMLGIIDKMVLNLNRHYSFVVKAGILANYNLGSIKSQCGSRKAAEMISGNDESLFDKDKEAWAIIEYRKNFLDEFGRYSAETEYELSSPRFYETGHNISVKKAARWKKTDKLSLDSKIRTGLKYFRIYESLKVIFKTMMLREISLLRRILIATGTRSGYGEDIFYLTLNELPGIFGQDLREAIRQRKEEREFFRNMELPVTVKPDDLRGLASLEAALNVSHPDLKELSMTSAHQQVKHGLKGISVNGFEFNGTALIYKSGRDIERSDHNSILITRYASPNLVEAFLGVRGIITETGGLLSHLAIVAREQGFPLVLQVEDATMVIREGDRLTADKNGRIILG
jgi:phosphohistidine swiveling domain-containing protein